MKYSQTCEHCQSVTTAYTHNLNNPMIGSLRKLINFYKDKKRACNINKELKLTHNQICNFPKLQYFGLVKRIGDGEWLPTQKAVAFCNGEATVMVPAATIQNEVLPDNHPAWQTHKKSRRERKITDFFEPSYKEREEYRDEKRANQTSFL